MNFNDTHPEMRDDEKFVTNDNNSSYRHIGWETKRKGEISYTRDGEIIPSMFPVFMKKKEWENRER